MKVEMNNIGIRIGEHLLIDDITLTMHPGTLTAVIGPNGAGKSTLLRLLAGDVAPSSGAITYDAEPLAHTSVRQLARLRAVLSQSHTSDIPFTVTQVVTMGRFPYRFDPSNTPAIDQQAVNHALEDLDLLALIDRPVRTLSGGEQQRVAIARVLAQNAPVVLLDEPTTALDIKHQESVITLIEGLRPRGHTVVAVLHDLNLATHFDQTLLLDHGRVSAAGPPRDVLTAEILSAVYSHPIDVVDHPTRPGVLMLPRAGPSPSTPSSPRSSSSSS